VVPAPVLEFLASEAEFERRHAAALRQLDNYREPPYEDYLRNRQPGQDWSVQPTPPAGAEPIPAEPIPFDPGAAAPSSPGATTEAAALAGEIQPNPSKSNLSSPDADTPRDEGHGLTPPASLPAPSDSTPAPASPPDSPAEAAASTREIQPNPSKSNLPPLAPLPAPADPAEPTSRPASPPDSAAETTASTREIQPNPSKSNQVQTLEALLRHFSPPGSMDAPNPAAAREREIPLEPGEVREVEYRQFRPLSERVRRYGGLL
ncbi:MAG: hypothetical protein NTV51_27235, partial [Verrucomicrobia bacterium]|nr:hypothetical protein [Verrucomicrobiota bacterium]